MTFGTLGITKMALTGLVASGMLAAPMVASGAHAMAAMGPILTKVSGGSVSGTVTPNEVSKSSVTPFTVKNVGGGTWVYTVNRGFNGTTVTSDYVNNTYYHSATAICGSDVSTVYAVATQWARASANAGLFADYAMYWNNYTS